MDSALIERASSRAAFGQRRKTLRNALCESPSAEQIAAAGVDPRARAEQLAPSAFVALAQYLARKVDA